MSTSDLLSLFASSQPRPSSPRNRSVWRFGGGSHWSGGMSRLADFPSNLNRERRTFEQLCGPQSEREPTETPEEDCEEDVRHEGGDEKLRAHGKPQEAPADHGKE